MRADIMIESRPHDLAVVNARVWTGDQRRPWADALACSGDKATSPDQAPLSGARVVMHPYRAVTDEQGVAKVRVAKGTYKLFVSQTRYVTFGLPVEVDRDMTTRAELSIEPVTERN